MHDAPAFFRVAALIGDPARAEMLNALMNGQALTASELAEVARVTRQTASSHLGKLIDAGLVAVLPQGRHRYFRIAAPDVAVMLEGMMGVARLGCTTRVTPGPRDTELRRARRCYDHLAGELAVEAFDLLVARGFLHASLIGDPVNTLALSAEGAHFFSGLGILIPESNDTRRALCRPCLDWSARRYHLAGSLGKALLEHCCRQGWARPVKGSRIVRFSSSAEAKFRKMLLT